MLGPQEGHFKRDSVNLFLDSEYRVTPQMDRMGVRVEGPALVHVAPEAADIVSDGVTPGTIQVPGNGQPIILLADCQTVGGYPKIATVISADLPRLAHLKPGQGIRFCAVDAAAARLARLEREAQWQHWFGGIDGGLPNPAALESMASGCWGGWEGEEGDGTD
jgi:allophanate hydrolase